MELQSKRDKNPGGNGATKSLCIGPDLLKIDFQFLYFAAIWL